LVLPQHDVVLEEHGVAGTEVDLGDRHQLALDLAGAVGEAELGHVAQSRGFTPAGVRNLVAFVLGRATGQTADGAWRILRPAPLTLDPIHRSFSISLLEPPQLAWIG